MSHKTEVEAIRKLIVMLGGRCNVTHQSGRLHGSAGIPDLYIQMPVAHNGLACLGMGEDHREHRAPGWWVEVKVGKDRLSDHQKSFRWYEEERCGGVVLVGGLDAVIAHLHKLGWKVQ